MAAPGKSGTDWLKNQTKKIGDGAKLPVDEVRAAIVQVEAWLQSHDVQYAPPAQVPLHLIDEKRSRTNQARRDAIVAESVDRFATAMKAGAAFPPIVCFVNGGKLVIIDGNNRQAAAKKAAKESLLGIIVAEDTPSEMIQLLTVEANAHHGVTPELSWRLQQAFHLVSIGFNDIQAAASAGVTVQQIRAARQVQEADARARALKISGFNGLPISMRQVLSPVKDDAVFFQASKVALDTGMTTDEVREMIRHCKTLGAEGARVEYIGSVAKTRGIEAATRKAVGRAIHRVSSPKTALVTGIGQLMKVDEAALARQIVTVHDRDLVMQRLKLLEEKLLALQVAVDQLAELEG